MSTVTTYSYEDATGLSWYALKDLLPSVSFPEEGKITEDNLRELGITKIVKEVVIPISTIKAQKLAELKTARDSAEVGPLTIGENTYDFDDKSRERLDIALKSLSANVGITELDWTLSDNSTVKVTAADLLNVFLMAAQRSNELHELYRTLKEQVEACTTAEEINAITFTA